MSWPLYQHPTFSGPLAWLVDLTDPDLFPILSLFVPRAAPGKPPALRTLSQDKDSDKKNMEDMGADE